MFHILKRNSTPPYLTKDSKIVCGLPEGQRREAISYDEYKQLSNSGKLNVDRLCKQCSRGAGREKDES